ncbi:oxygenase MpaB family protein [Lentzea sp. DG1S-22]|uniref:oxygenase MpaB family protein n=1 Tax=Lentzea sp. DG1S-22 TaxID=3108822 RepID=UPI002E778139|nr:oxygenase MpaB family protein [Lentzea sp. DG1S-22]WVH82427.1 oxygenase MpaB family protein [Lentzea sp. DG1S-22]
MAGEAAFRPLGPDSLTWRYFGDWRNLLVVLWTGSMQNMHPTLGTAVEQHSQFFGERWQRVFRSFYPILGVVYDGAHARQTALKVRGYHTDIRGNDDSGHEYHALAPDVFYWAHAVFFMTIIRFGDRFMGGIGEAERQQLFVEHVQWYRLYGLSMRPVPGSWDEFQSYWDHMCSEVLVENKATRDVLNLTDLPRPRFLCAVPHGLWSPLWALSARLLTWLTVGLYDPVIRERLGVCWTGFDDRLHRAAGVVVHLVFRLLPHDRRFHPRARAGWRRSRGADAALLESPARHLPGRPVQPRWTRWFRRAPEDCPKA